MEHRHIGSSGLEVSVLGLGCNNLGGRLDETASVAAVRAALDLGVTLFDTADVYPMGKPGVSEEILGEALGSWRDDVVVATKFGYPLDESGEQQGGSRRYIVSAVEASLRRLRTDRIDLLQFHRPDPETPIEETLRALEDLIREGKARYVGCSNFPAWLTVEASWVAREHGLNGFVCAQEEYSLLARDAEREVIPALRAHGLGLLPYFPLASGLLTGKYRAGEEPPRHARLGYVKPLAERFLNERNLALVERYRAFCESRGRSLLDLAFSWLLAREPVSSVIAGASTPAQLEANAEAVTWSLSPEELVEVDRLAEA